MDSDGPSSHATEESTTTEHELGQCERANATGRTPVFVDGPMAGSLGLDEIAQGNTSELTEHLRRTV